MLTASVRQSNEKQRGQARLPDLELITVERLVLIERLSFRPQHSTVISSRSGRRACPRSCITLFIKCQKLNIAVRALNRRLNYILNLNPNSPAAALTSSITRACFSWISNNAAFPNFTTSDFKLRFDKNDQPAVVS